ncbi:MAG: signal recognition particle-docking protein FtsY [Rhizobiaceae bacterium]|nr:signal recognition particle-docking protein FtsY [Rhizobiaceae bacterium]
MAFGFIKKIFSFGRKQVEEVPAEDEAPQALEAPVPAAPAEPTPPPPAPAPAAPPLAPEPELEKEEVQPPDAPADIGPAQPREVPETPQTPERPSVDETPPDHPRPVSPAKPEPEKPAPKPAPAKVGPEPSKPEPQPVADKAAPKVEPTKPEPAPAKPTAKKEPKPAAPVEAPAPEKPTETAKSEPAAAEAPPPPQVEEPPAPPPAAVEPEQLSADPAVPAKPEPVEKEGPPKPAPTHRGDGTPAGKVTVSKSVERTAEAAPAPEPEQPKTSWLQRLRSGLSRSSKELSSSISGVFTKRKLDEDTLQDLEDVLIRADLGAETAMRIADTLSASRYGRDVSDQEVRGVMASEIEKVLSPVAQALELDLSHKPHVILVVGVNGTGKTTTIGKLAAKLVGGGLSVTLAAGDTFRAAAIEQLKIWGERTGSPVVASKLGADAAGLAWDAYEQAKEAGSDVLIIDTAGRLQNKAELMAELEKIVRVLGKHDPEAPHTVLQTVDATTGQNALNQVEIFRNVAGVNGLVMTKLDGTARGGILVAIAAKHKLPVYFIGVGEQVDDLEPFSAQDFAAAIAGTEVA